MKKNAIRFFYQPLFNQLCNLFECKMEIFENALSKVVTSVQQSNKVEIVSLWDSLGRILATNVLSDMDMPPFNKSAVDGYACRKADIAHNLKVLEVIAAGQFPTKRIDSNTCSKIMTGAPVPEGADCILMVEGVVEVDAETIRFNGNDTKTNIAIRGEDIKKGNVALTRGVCIEPTHIAIMAAVGLTQVRVALKPIVSILITGNELVEPENTPVGSQIRNSNGHQLVAQVIKSGASPNYFGIVADTMEATQQAIANALAISNVLVLTGGVSMGDFDYVPGVLKSMGVDIIFKSIAVQPGKPTLFGIKGNKVIFGLPGNPVSSLFQFEMLVKPAILKLMGAETPVTPSIKLPIAFDFFRKRNERLGLIPAYINASGEVEPVKYHGSAHIFALSNVNALVFAPIGVTNFTKGELVDVRQL
jgi:molybdopterin molybdotransferase